MGIATALTLLAAASSGSQTDPVELFRAACIEGTVALPQKRTQVVSYQDLPIEAQRMLAVTRLESNGNLGNPTDRRPKKISNAIYALRESPEIFLILPKTDDKLEFSKTCAVLVNGKLLNRFSSIFGTSDNVAILRRETQLGGSLLRVQPTFMSLKESSHGYEDLGYMSDYADGHLIVASQSLEWTIFSASPDVLPCRLTKYWRGVMEQNIHLRSRAITQVQCPGR